MPERFPGEAAARAAIEAARRREAELALLIQSAELRRREAVEARAAVVRRLASGEDVSATALSQATTAIGAAEERVAILQDALRDAEAATKRAEAEMDRLKRAELVRRAPLMKAEGAEMRRRGEDDTRRGWDLDLLASDLLRVNAKRSEELDLDGLLARSDRYRLATAGARG